MSKERWWGAPENSHRGRSWCVGTSWVVLAWHVGAEGNAAGRDCQVEQRRGCGVGRSDGPAEIREAGQSIWPRAAANSRGSRLLIKRPRSRSGGPLSGPQASRQNDHRTHYSNQLQSLQVDRDSINSNSRRRVRSTVWEDLMKCNRRKFLHLTVGAAALPTLSTIARARLPCARNHDHCSVRRWRAS